jgi:hypothetical protein
MTVLTEEVRSSALSNLARPKSPAHGPLINTSSLVQKKRTLKVHEFVKSTTKKLKLKLGVQQKSKWV